MANKVTGILAYEINKQKQNGGKYGVTKSFFK